MYSSSSASADDTISRGMSDKGEELFKKNNDSRNNDDFLLCSDQSSQPVRLLRSSAQCDSSDDDDSCAPSNVFLAEPTKDEEWKKTIQVGSSYQATVPDEIADYLRDQLIDFQLDNREDKLLWQPSRLESKLVESYLAKALKEGSPTQNGLFRLPQGAHLRDDERALYTLHQADYDVAEAERRLKSVTETDNSLGLNWSEADCRNFESGLRAFGKHFFLIQQNKLKEKSLGDLIQFYYFWKKTERHDVFANKVRLEKKKYTLHPGITDYMDRFLDELDNPNTDKENSPRNRSPCVNRSPGAAFRGGLRVQPRSPSRGPPGSVLQRPGFGSRGNLAAATQPAGTLQPIQSKSDCIVSSPQRQPRVFRKILPAISPDIRLAEPAEIRDVDGKITEMDGELVLDTNVDNKDDKDDKTLTENVCHLRVPASGKSAESCEKVNSAAPNLGDTESNNEATEGLPDFGGKSCAIMEEIFVDCRNSEIAEISVLPNFALLLPIITVSCAVATGEDKADNSEDATQWAANPYATEEDGADERGEGENGVEPATKKRKLSEKWDSEEGNREEVNGNRRVDVKNEGAILECAEAPMTEAVVEESVLERGAASLTSKQDNSVLIDDAFDEKGTGGMEEDVNKCNVSVQKVEYGSIGQAQLSTEDTAPS